MEGAPTWVLWLGAGIGSLLAAFVMRMGWKSQGGEKLTPPKTVGFEAGIVDSTTTLQLASSIEGLTELMQQVSEHSREQRRRAQQTAEDLVRSVNNLRDELEKLRREIGDATAAIERQK